ncbi:MAG: DUF1572 family protein [Candidatus Eisenbacteria bacterium]|nr:DUF1572 family protein [Candidatus Eisenbacteria bacterium]
MESPNSGQDFLTDSIAEFRQLKAMSEKALVRMSDDDFFRPLDAESNPAAIVVKHLAGNLRSRWVDFLTSDGEKPDRNRDTEFELNADDTRESLMTRWNRGWEWCFQALESLTPADLTRVVMIRSEPYTVTRAIIRQLSHYAYHAGQIVTLAKHATSANWQSLSVPRGASDEFNRAMLEKYRS